MSIVYDESEDNPLNVKIKELWDYMTLKVGPIGYEDFKRMCREIYEMGFSGGQEYVWAVRAGKFVNDKGEPVDIYGKPREDENLTSYTITSSGSETVTYKVEDGKLVEVKNVDSN